MTRKMKDSGIEWIGEIPEVWEIVGVKDAFVRKNTKANKKNPTVLSLARDGIKIRDISNNEGQLASDYTNYNPVCVDDLLLNPMDLISGDNCNISKVDGVISPAYINLRYKKHTNPKLYNYYFKYLYWYKVFFAHGKGVSYENRWTLNFETLRKIPLPLPSKEEQDKIANFLDQKTSEIDGIKKELEKEIEVLEDYKKSIIYEAVTKGLDKNVEMKDSGVEWIGEIPKDWKVSRLTGVAKPIRGNSAFKKDELLGEGKYVAIQYGRTYKIDEINENYNAFVNEEFYKPSQVIVYGDTILISTSETVEDLGHSAFYARKDMGLLGGEQIGLRPSREVRPKYLYYCTKSVADELKQFASGIKVFRYNITDLKTVKIPLPKISQQEKTAEYLDEKTSEIDSIISDKKEQLQVLEEYKKSMIYEYVTGKKAVE